MLRGENASFAFGHEDNRQPFRLAHVSTFWGEGQNSLLVGEVSAAEILLSSSLTYGAEDMPTALVSANGYALGREGVIHPNPGALLSKPANSDSLASLEEWLLGGRTSTLRHMPSGEVLPLNQEEEPVVQIECKMNDGQEILLQAFASDYRLCVVGEGDFCLKVQPQKVKELLEVNGWKMPE
ncbi:MAG: hypothetical protein COA70_12835 [Planctomycetota bacterium]|nr:MAG: hypothetical protein COA70_12835 [Planctomycetota bacterium]